MAAFTVRELLENVAAAFVANVEDGLAHLLVVSIVAVCGMVEEENGNGDVNHRGRGVFCCGNLM